MLEIRDLEISFYNGRKQTRRTDRVSFDVQPGEVVALVGESGCGKSITALSVLGLLPRQGRVTGGEILYQGRNLLALSEKEMDEIRGKEIAMIFQDIMYSLNPVFTIGSQMIEGMRRHLGYTKKQAQEKAVYSKQVRYFFSITPSFFSSGSLNSPTFRAWSTSK